MKAAEFTNNAKGPLADVEIDELLIKTSRTFALCIPMLPMGLQRQVGISYLLFRIADTIEDGNQIAGHEKLQLLELYSGILQSAKELDSTWISQANALQQHDPSDDGNDIGLFKQASRVIASAIEIDDPIAKIIFCKVRASTDGMAEFVANGNDQGNIQLNSLSQLHKYCYCVAGIVGEMLTELFVLDQPQLMSVANSLRSRASAFGEALQLVNILKDSDCDRNEGRQFIPTNVSREALTDRAGECLTIANQYIELLQEHGVDQGILQFTQFPVLLASRTLDRLTTDGPGAKVDRAELVQILTQIESTELATAIRAGKTAEHKA